MKPAYVRNPASQTVHWVTRQSVILPQDYPAAASIQQAALVAIGRSDALPPSGTTNAIALTRMYGLFRLSMASAINSSASLGVASTSLAVAPASLSRTISFRVSRTTLCFRHSLTSRWRCHPSQHCLSSYYPLHEPLTPAVLAEVFRLYPRSLPVVDGLQRACRSSRNPITTAVSIDLLWSQWCAT